MLFWDEFDTRTTKVLCDKCHEDCSKVAFQHLRRPWWKFWVNYKRDVHAFADAWTRQFELSLFGAKVVLTFFKKRHYQGTILYKGMR